MHLSKVVGKNSSNEIRCADFFGNFVQYSVKSMEFFNQVLVLIFDFAAWVLKWQGYKLFFQVVSTIEKSF